MCQIRRILRQNCSHDSTEITEGVTSTTEIYGGVANKVFTSPFSQQEQFTLIADVFNLN